MEKAATIVTGGAALVMAVATALLGFTIPSMWALQSDMGAAKATLASIDKKLDGFEKKLDAVQGTAEQVAKRAEMIELRMTARDADPSTIVAQSGLRPLMSFFGIRIAQKIYALPRTDAAAVDLEKAGAKREAITPSAYGYLLGNLDQSGRFVPVSASGSQE